MTLQALIIGAKCRTLCLTACRLRNQPGIVCYRIAGQALFLNGTGGTLTSTSPVFLAGTVTPAANASSSSANATYASPSDLPRWTWLCCAYHRVHLSGCAPKEKR